jgi:LacI family transcriptional regulator, repressor for deo operon, udp, cdd, tsx, nupC, and nupG
MKPRLRDVAARAGVSEATVSRVVNGRSGVAETTRRDVLRVLEELGYTPVGLAPAGFTPPSSGAVGLVVPELENPIFPAFAQAIEARLAAQGFTVLLSTASVAGIRERQSIAKLLERDVQGLIVVSGLHADTEADHGVYRELADRGVPLVLVNGYLEALDVPFVSCDIGAAGEIGVRHLVELGHRRIGLASGPHRYQPTQRRREGYRRGLQAAGLPVDESLIVETVYSVEGGHLAGVRLLDLGVTAILAGSDLMALGAVRAVRQRGLDVPGDVSIVGYDGVDIAAFTDPPLTTIGQPVRAMGAAAAAALIQQLTGSGPAQRGEYLFRPELIVRRSSGPLQVSTTEAAETPR